MPWHDPLTCLAIGIACGALLTLAIVTMTEESAEDDAAANRGREWSDRQRGLNQSGGTGI
jgi:hypothetical protein